MPRIAVVHEWFTRWAGSEAVLEQILACLTDADLFAITSRPDAEGGRRLAGRAVRTSFRAPDPLAGQPAARRQDLHGNHRLIR